MTAHLVVRGPDGKRFDITPFANENGRASARFIAHVGDDLGFFEIKREGHSFTCLHDLLDNVSVEDWCPSDDNDMNPDCESFGDVPLNDP